MSAVLTWSKVKIKVNETLEVRYFSAFSIVSYVSLQATTHF